MDLPGHAIPYDLSRDEVDAFLAQHAGEPDLVQYLQTMSPPWGVTVQEAFGTLWVWYDANLRLHVIDVTGMPIVNGIAQAVYVTPTQAFIDQLLEEAQHVVDLVRPTINLGLVAVIIVGAIMLTQPRTAAA